MQFQGNIIHIKININPPGVWVRAALNMELRYVPGQLRKKFQLGVLFKGNLPSDVVLGQSVTEYCKTIYFTISYFDVRNGIKKAKSNLMSFYKRI